MGRRCEIYLRHIYVLWVQCYKTIDPDETLDRFVLGCVCSRRPEKAGQAAPARTDLPCVCRAACRQNITGLPPSTKACPQGHAGHGKPAVTRLVEAQVQTRYAGGLERGRPAQRSRWFRQRGGKE